MGAAGILASLTEAVDFENEPNFLHRQVCSL